MVQTPHNSCNPMIVAALRQGEQQRACHPKDDSAGQPNFLAKSAADGW